MTRRASAFGAALVALATVVAVGGPASRVAAQESPEPAGWILVDADTGEILAAGNEHEPLRPASTTKIMTALVAVERLDPTEPVPITETAAEQPPSKVDAEVGEEWPLETAIAGIMISSANDLAYALAQAVGDGSLDTWVEIVNATAQRYGMQDSTFNDPAGFDAAGETLGDGPFLSAYDIAIAARNALAVPALAAIAATTTYEFERPDTETTSVMENHNKMLPGGARAYDGATGFKTGFTEAAGHTFVGTAQRGGRELIVVILDTYDFYGWAGALLDQGFATPPGEGTGVYLPDIAVEPYAQRHADLLGFVAAAMGPSDESVLEADTLPALAEVSGAADASGSDGAGAPDGESVSTVVTDESAAATTAGSQGENGEAAGAPTSQGSSLSGTTIAAIAVTVCAGAFFVRRRQIQVRKRRRRVRRATTSQAIRRGTLPIADGRPPVHGRASSPPRVEATDSHVRLVPNRERPR